MSHLVTHSSIALSLILLGCSSIVGAADGVSPSQIVSLRIEPAQINLSGKAASQRVLVLARGADGIERDISAESHLRVSDNKIAALEDLTHVVAVADGQTSLTVEAGGKRAKASVQTNDTGRERTVTFGRDVVGILTKQGCNASGCHGSVKGRGGFKLSLDGLSPEDDYEWVVLGGTYQVLTPQPLGARVSRIDTKDPARSLLLRKPTMAVPHGGGRRLEPGSADYQTIAAWIASGATKSIGSSAERMDISPQQTILDATGKRQMLVTAYFKDGHREDITSQVRYESLNPEIANVNVSGLVTAGKSGEAAIVVRWPGYAGVSRIGVLGHRVDSYPAVSQYNFIDRHVFEKLRNLQIVPSELSSDTEFLRRVCLDLTGTLPPPNRVKEFAESRDTEEAGKLVDVLLHSPEYNDFWTFRLSDVFRVRGEYSWLDVFFEWVRKSVAENKPYDQIARENIAAQGYEGPSRAGMYGINKPPAVEQMVNEKVRVFFGLRLDCAQCHNHPFDRWTQNQYWGLAAFFGRMNKTGWAFDNAIFDDPKGAEEDYLEATRRSRIIEKSRIHARSN